MRLNPFESQRGFFDQHLSSAAIGAFAVAAVEAEAIDAVRVAGAAQLVRSESEAR